VEWLEDLPEELRRLPRRHPATWQMTLLQEFEKVARLQIHIIVVRHRLKRDVSFERGGVQFQVLKAPVWARVGSLFWLDTILIRNACRRIKPDLVHAWGSEKGAGLIASRLGYPYIFTIQGLLSWHKQRVPLPLYSKFAERLERISLARAPLATTEAGFAVRFLKERYPRLHIQQIEHAPNRIFFEVNRRRAGEGPERGVPLHFCSVGELGFLKGTDLIFAALERLRPEMPFKLTLICGPNRKYVESLRAKASEGLWQRVEFRHDIPPAEVARELAKTTLFLLPTRADVSPNAVKEAVVAGVPVLASEIGAIADYVRPGENGFVFPPGDLDGFVATIRKALGHPLFARGLVDEASLARSREYLSPERMAGGFLRTYEGLTGQDRTEVRPIGPVGAV